jgi:hypothetical protein
VLERGTPTARLPTPIDGEDARITGRVFGVPRCTLSEPPCLAPVSAIQAEVRLDGSTSYRFRTEEDGTFAADVAPGDYVITFVTVGVDAQCPTMDYELEPGYLIPFRGIECIID